MSELNLKTITVAIMSNKKCTNTNVKKNCSYTIYLEPIMLTVSTFKNAFFPYNYYAPNEFLDVTKFNYYKVIKRSINNDNCNEVDCYDNLLDCSGDEVDCSGDEVDCSDGLCPPLSLYQETLSMFMSYNNILNENAINPKLLIDFTNEIFKYKNFKDLPIALSYMSWTNVLEWINDNDNGNSILCLHIELHYYDPHFMPGYVKYVFPYYIC